MYCTVLYLVERGSRQGDGRDNRAYIFSYEMGSIPAGNHLVDLNTRKGHVGVTGFSRCRLTDEVIMNELGDGRAAAMKATRRFQIVKKLSLSLVGCLYTASKYYLKRNIIFFTL